MKNFYLICVFTILISLQYAYSFYESDNPVRTEIQILTPPAQRIAGDTFLVVLKLYDKDNSLFQGPYCFNNVVFQDTLGNGGKQDPIVVSDSGIDTINEFPSTAHLARLCFNDGIDTTKIVLYNAPVDNVHKLFIHLDNVLVTSTEPFHLYPGRIDSIDIQNADGTPVTDTVSMDAPDDSWMFYAAGFDRYGNRIPGWVSCIWSTSGDLHQVTDGQTVGQIFYETVSVQKKESGVLTATPADPSVPPYVKDQVFIEILGPAIILSKAITRDMNGNGYLDHIELHFALPLSLPANFSFSGLSITYGTTKFVVAGIENNTGRTGIIWSLIVNEVQNNIPQTSWKPYVSFDRNDSVSIAGADSLQCQDGAGPVVWIVMDRYGSYTDHSKDVITVTFSESVKRTDGSLDINDLPSNIFYVWEKDTNGTQFIRVDSILAGINGLTQVVKDSIVSFIMSNGMALTVRHFININTDKMFITDNAQNKNFPYLNNQKARVNIIPPTSVENIPSDSGRNQAITSSSNNGCGCGTGTGLAFIPPIFVKTRYHIRKCLKKIG